MATEHGGAAACNVNVAVRARPLLDWEEQSRCVEVLCDGTAQVGRNPGDDKHLIASSCPRFVFDRGFGTESSQEELFEWVQPAIDGCFEGYNAAILAYGQTGSGKTYSMGTAAIGLVVPEEMGLVPRAFQHIAAGIQKRGDEAEFEMRASFVEVHDDNVNDLLADPGTSTDVIIREDARGEVILVGATEAEAKNCDDLLRLLERGTLSRTTAATRMNATSSRSHAVLTLVIEQRRRPGSASRQRGQPERVRAKLQLVDLAGSERNKRTGTTGKHFKESVNINQGLLALANCINVLSDESAQRVGMHVPYRDHKLTRLLRNSLGGNARTYMLACCSVSASNFQETLNTLRYAARARNIKNTPVVNRGDDDDQLAKMEREMATLKRELSEAAEDPSGLMAQIQSLREKNDTLEERVAQLSHALRTQPAGAGEALLEVRSSELDDCDDVEVLRRALRAKDVQLAKAEAGLRKDEEMIGTLANEMEDLAWANSKLQEENTCLKEKVRDLRAGGTAELRPSTPPNLEDDDSVRIGDDEGNEEVSRVDDAGEVDVPAKTDLMQEQERWMNGQRRMKEIEIDGREAESEFKLHHQMMQKRVRELESQMQEKANLIRDLERDKESHAALQQQYSAVLAELRFEVEEKERRLGGIKSQRGRTEEEKLTIAEQGAIVSEELELLRARVKEQEAAMKRLKTADRKIEILQEELRRMKSERASVSQRIKMDTDTHKERERAAAEEIKRLKAQSDASYRMVRQLKLQVREQQSVMAKKQSELDAARRNARPASRGGNGSTPNRNGSTAPAPVASKADIGRLKKHLLKELESELRKAEYEQQLTSELQKLKELKGERNKQASLLKALEMRVHRGQALSEDEQRSYRELKDGVEDLNAEMEFLDGSVSQVRKRVAKADGQVVRMSLEKITPLEAKGLVPELLVTLRRARVTEGDTKRAAARLEVEIRDIQTSASKQRQAAQLAEMELKRRLEEQKREFEYKLLSAYQQMDSSVANMYHMSTERASAGGPPPPEAQGPQERQMTKIKDDQISILTEHNTLYKRRIKELTRKMKALQQLVIKQEMSENVDSRPSDAYHSTQLNGRPSTADSLGANQGRTEMGRPMMNSAAAAASLYSDGGATEPPPPSNKTPERSHPPSGQQPLSDAKSRDKDRERRRAEKVSSRRDGSIGEIEPPAVIPAQDEQPVHSLTAPNRTPEASMTPPPGGESAESWSQPRRQSQPVADAGVASERSSNFDDRTSQLDLLRRGHEVLVQHGSSSEGKQQRGEPVRERDRGHRRRYSSPDRASVRGAAPSHHSRPITPREQHDADLIQASIDDHAERLRADVEGEEHPLPRLGRERAQEAGTGVPGTGPFMTRDEHERRKKERAARLASMRQEAANQWRNSSATDDPLGREWASRQKGGGKGSDRSERGGVSERAERTEKRRGAPAR